MDWDDPQEGFRFVLLERVEPEKNMHKYYLVAWMPTLFDKGAVVRIFGRKGGFQRVLAPKPHESLHEAWPIIRRVVKTRLRHGYRVVGAVKVEMG